MDQQPNGSSLPWNKTRIASLLRVEYPIIQGPLGGLSTQQLAATVSNFGGLGSFGAHGLAPSEFLPLWAGQSANLSRESDARALLEILVSDVSSISIPTFRKNPR